MSRPATYHQDYIARIRYSNVLPPPPNPPKLLDIPGTGLGDGQYTSAGFASRLAREQPLNIEADGELGMPIDLIGIPGVFSGDESAIYGLDEPPPPHPDDRPLLRPLAQLGKPTSLSAGVSFLRRTEYITTDQARTRTDSLLRGLRAPKKRKQPEANLDNDPVRMLRGIAKGFDIAYPEDAYKGPDAEGRLRADAVSAEEQAAWDNPRHPSDPDLTVLDTYPILPDLDAFPDSGNFFVVKFANNPVAQSENYDSRLDVSILRPVEPWPNALAQHQAQEQAHQADPTLPKPQSVPWVYEFFLPETEAAAEGFKAALDVNNPDHDDLALYGEENADSGRRSVRFQLQRTYETHTAADFTDDQWGSVAMALHDEEFEDDDDTGDSGRRPLQKAAYIYPVVQRAGIRARRRTGAAAGAYSQDEQRLDFLDVAVRAPLAAEAERRQGHRRALEQEQETEPEAEPEAAGNGTGEAGEAGEAGDDLDEGGEGAA